MLTLGCRYELKGVDFGPIDGGPDCIGVTANARTLLSGDYHVPWAAAFRVVYDLGDWNATKCVSGVGQSINPLDSDFGDQADLFRRKQFRTCPFTMSCRTSSTVDCNSNNYPDVCDIFDGNSADCDENGLYFVWWLIGCRNMRACVCVYVYVFFFTTGIPDECESGVVCLTSSESSPANKLRGMLHELCELLPACNTQKM